MAARTLKRGISGAAKKVFARAGLEKIEEDATEIANEGKGKEKEKEKASSAPGSPAPDSTTPGSPAPPPAK
jgi:hypothetical protein